MRTLAYRAFLTVAAVAIAACSSTPATSPRPSAVGVVSAPVSNSSPPAAPPAVAPAPRPIAPAPVVTVKLAPHLDPANAISTNRSVYFDFESVAVKPEYSGMLERHGQYLASVPALSIRVEGHTDERGGSEYNLALGQKRAEAVVKALKLYGVRESQMEAVSWGKERPKAAGHDESSWSQNRRADLTYPSR